ncbi:hypothetical protein BDV97DRAFT_357619 [Delphinella strobiligena]|nr:hypothetical protein BDV97DRAFT_357619 [Delphinella strobiligena]
MSSKSCRYVPKDGHKEKHPKPDLNIETKKQMDILAKECVGLSVFIMPNTGETVTSDKIERQGPANANQSSNSNVDTPSSISVASERRNSILSPKRLSQALDFAMVQFDSLYKQAQGLLGEERPLHGEGMRHDLESGGQFQDQAEGSSGRRVIGIGLIERMPSRSIIGLQN